MTIYPLDKQIDIVVQILKLLQKNDCKYDERNFTPEMLNDVILTQKTECPSETGIIEYQGCKG